MGAVSGVYVVFNPYDEWVGLDPHGWNSDRNYGVIFVIVIWLGGQIAVGLSCIWLGARMAKRRWPSE